LRLAGSCTATLPVPKARLQLALQYLIGALIDAQPAGGKVMLLMGEGPAGTVLRAADEHEFRETDGRDWRLNPTKPLTNRPSSGATTSTLRRVKLAIASRVFETAGASLVFGDGSAGRPVVDPVGFILRIPHRAAPTA